MCNIIGIEIVKQVSPEWSLSDIALIKKVTIQPGEINMSVLSQRRIKNVGWPIFDNDFLELDISFSGFQNIKLDFSEKDIFQIRGLDIVDVSKNYLENINFKIEDYEEGIISFYCETVSILNAKLNSPRSRSND